MIPISKNKSVLSCLFALAFFLIQEEGLSQTEPDSLALSLAHAKTQYDEGKLEEARESVDKILGQHGENIEALVLHGQITQSLGIYPDSEQSLRKAVELSAEHPTAWLWLGYTCYYAGETLRLDTMRRSASYIVSRYRDAVNAFRKAVEISPKDRNAWIGLGLSLFYVPDLAEAEKAYRNGIEACAREDTGKLRYLLGNLYRQYLGKPAEAIPFLSEAAAIEPRWADVHFELGEAYFATEQEDPGSEHFLKALTIAPGYQVIYDALWRVFGQEMLYEKGQAFLQRALDAGIKDPKIPWYQGYFAFRAEEYDRAIPFFELALKMNPAFDSAHTILATSYQKKGDVDSAVQSLEKALALKPENAAAKDGLVALARERGGAGDYEKALSLFGRIIELFPEEAELRSDQALTLANLGRVEEAIQSYRKAMEIDPLDTQIVNDLALVYEGMRQFDEAIALYEQAEQTAQDLDATENLGVLHFKFGRNNEAMNQFAKVLRIDPNRERSLYMFHKCLRAVPRDKRKHYLKKK